MKNIYSLRNFNRFKLRGRLGAILLFFAIVSFISSKDLHGQTVTKNLYLSETNKLDRNNPANPVDNTTSSTGILSIDPAQVTINNKTVFSGVPASSTVSFSHQTLAGFNRFLLVGVSLKDRVITSMTYGGTPMTLVGEQIANGNAKIFIYRLSSPAVGTANITINLSGNADKGIVVGAMTFNGVDLNNPLGTFASAQTKSTNPTVNVNTSSGQLIFNVVTIKTLDLTGVGSGQTSQWNVNTASDVTGAGSTKTATGSTETISWTSGSEDWAIGAVPVRPASVSNQAVFTLDPVLCQNLVVSSGTIDVENYLNILSGTMPANPAITATLKYGANTILSLTNPSYNSVTGLLSWSGTLASDVSVPSGSAVILEISTSQSGVLFRIDYDSSTKPSKVNFNTSTYITIDNFDVYDAPYPAGSVITTDVPNNTTAYIRITASDPFGTYDVTGADVEFLSPASGPLGRLRLAPQHAAGYMSMYGLHQ